LFIGDRLDLRQQFSDLEFARDVGDSFVCRVQRFAEFASRIDGWIRLNPI